MNVTFDSPAFTLEEARLLASRHYSLAAEARSLPSERDQNFHLRAADGHEFVLKIAHAAEERAALDLQHRALAHLAERAPDLALPRVVPTTNGQELVAVADSTRGSFLMRMLTYVPGRLLAHTKPQRPELLWSLGELLGTLDQALLDFDHPAARRDLKWDLARAGWAQEYVGNIADPARRAIVEGFLARYEAEVLPQLPTLRHSIIYNDANDYNVLVGGDDPLARRVVAVIDFGDMVHTATVCELAIAAAYAMLDKADPLGAAASLVAGYHSALPLSEAELALLFPLICTRLCVSVVNSALQREAEPDNDYLVISERPAWALLERLATTSPALAHSTFRAACGLPAVPHTPAVVDWLARNSSLLRPVVDRDLRGEGVLVFDLSVGGDRGLGIGDRGLGAGKREARDADATAAFTRILWEEMAAAGAVVGVGRYDEARLIYTAPFFRVEGENGPEWRTVHLGIDLFVAAGSPVYAPLAGTVYAFGNNARRLDYGPWIVLEHRVDGGLTFYTLYGHLSAQSLLGLERGRAVAAGEQIATVGNFPENGDWPPHLHLQLITDLLDTGGDFPGVALARERELWRSFSPDANLLLGIPAERFPPDELRAEQIRELRARHVAPSFSISYRRPLTIVRGRGQYLYDADGRAYLDAVNNVPHVGHCHPRVVCAGQRQMALLNTNTRYLHPALVRYAERLCATLPEPLRVCFFVCSGSEANELALRLARAHTGQRDMVVVDVGYHGNTTSLVEISSYKFDGPGGFAPPPYVYKVMMPDVYRGPFKANDPQAGQQYAADVGAAVAGIVADGKGPAGFICESILSCGGQIVLPPGYLEAAYGYVRAAGGVCIADEVQTGFGRVGSHFWAFETQGVVPDIVTLGKPIGNGHPLGAVVTTPEIAASFNNGMEYFNTFGGNPVSCAIGMAVLDVIADEGLQAHALRVGNHLLAGLRGLMAKHPLVGDARGLGLFSGIELVRDRTTLEPADREATYLVNRLREHGILLSTDGPYHNVIKIKPPLVFTQANADLLVATLDKVLGEL